MYLLNPRCHGSLSADFQIIDDLRTFRPREVWLRGQCVARDGVSLLPAGEARVENNFAARPVTAGGRKR